MRVEIPPRKRGTFEGAFSLLKSVVKDRISALSKIADCAKAAKLIDISLGRLTYVILTNHLLDEGARWQQLIWHADC